MLSVLLLVLLLPAADPLPAADAGRRDALTRYGVGRIRARHDLPAKAVRQFETAAKSDPTSPEPLRPLIKLYSEVGRDVSAIRAAETVLKLDPDDAETGHALGKLLYGAKQYPEAIRRLRQAAESPRVADKPTKRYALLRDLARAGADGSDWPAAEKALRAADQILTDHRDLLVKVYFESPMELDRERAAVWEKLGEALAGQKKPADAIAQYREAHELATKAGDKISAARLDWNLSGVLMTAGKADDALTHLTRFLDLQPSGPAAYERLAKLLRDNGKSDTIAGTLARLADKNPENETIRWVLATELTQHDPAMAARLFRELSEKATDPEFFKRLVRFYKDTGRMKDLLDLADELFRASRPWQEGQPRPENTPPADTNAVDRARALVVAVKAEPKLADPLAKQATTDARARVSRTNDTWELVAALAERDGQLTTAEVLLRAASPAGGRDVALTLLDVLAKQRKWDALKTEAAMMIARSNPQRSLRYDVYLATAHAELGEAAAALKALATLANVQAEGRLWARLQKPYILNILGRHKEAAAECQELLKEFPNPSDARQVRFSLSNAYLGLKEYAKAEAELRAVLDDDPDDQLALNNLGYNLADQGRNLSEAEAMIRRAIEIDQYERTKLGDPEAKSGTYLDSLGWVLFRRGKLTEARQTLEQAATLPDMASDAVVWDHLGDVCFRLGDKAVARKHWEKAAELYTDSHVGRQHDRLQEVRRKLK